ncbi:hypothetical protein SASPL_131600 [Salvia splendens]|uniref:Uncharacterized protein n=1 Tax=Salvia splendens TaxID=180675 RepID=A0A8X8ZLR0_SALSN|nr:hypothetical protein SASPL_131600 [Salvia splendens]
MAGKLVYSFLEVVKKKGSRVLLIRSARLLPRLRLTSGKPVKHLCYALEERRLIFSKKQLKSEIILDPSSN